MKIYKNLKLHHWTYSSTLVNSQSLSFKRMFFCLCFLHQNYTEGTSSIPFLPFQSLFAAITHIHQYSKTCTPQSIKLLHEDMYKFFPNKEGEAVLFWYFTFFLLVSVNLQEICLLHNEH